MANEKEKAHRMRWKLLDSAVIATLIGALLTGSFTLIQTCNQNFISAQNKLNRAQKEKLEKKRMDEEWALENLRNSQEKAERESHIIFERLLKLQNLYFSAKSGDELLRLDKSVDWMERNSKDVTTKDLIASFRMQLLKKEFQIQLEKKFKKEADAERKKIRESLNNLEKLEKKENEDKLKDKDAAAIKAKIDKNIKSIDLKGTKEITKESRKLLAITEIICIDPQSSWPKKCDQVYLKVNGKRLWDTHLIICRGNRFNLNDKIYFDDQTEIELWEYDSIADDLIGKFKVIKNLNNSYGRVNLSGSSNKGDWNYTMIFNVIK